MKNDYDKTPPQSDVIVSEGPNAGETLRQIFKHEGDVLIACTAPLGAARPTEFTSRPGSGHSLSVWLRTTASPPPGLLAWLSWTSPEKLTWRSWTSIAVLVTFASIIGGVSQDLEASLGRWVGILGGWLAAVCLFTAVFLLVKRSWQQAIVMGIGTSVVASTFEGLRATLTPTLGTPGSIFVSASTAFVAMWLVLLVIAGLMKIRI